MSKNRVGRWRPGGTITACQSGPFSWASWSPYSRILAGPDLRQTLAGSEYWYRGLDIIGVGTSTKKESLEHLNSHFASAAKELVDKHPQPTKAYGIEYCTWFLGSKGTRHVWSFSCLWRSHLRTKPHEGSWARPPVRYVCPRCWKYDHSLNHLSDQLM